MIKNQINSVLLAASLICMASAALGANITVTESLVGSPPGGNRVSSPALPLPNTAVTGQVVICESAAGLTGCSGDVSDVLTFEHTTPNSPSTPVDLFLFSDPSPFTDNPLEIAPPADQGSLPLVSPGAVFVTE